MVEFKVRTAISFGVPNEKFVYDRRVALCQNINKMIEGLNPVLQAFLGTLFTWGVTALGSSLVFICQGDQVLFMKEIKLIYDNRVKRLKVVSEFFNWMTDISEKVFGRQSWLRSRSELLMPVDLFVFFLKL